MSNIDNTNATPDPSYREHEDEELFMKDVVQDDPELMYLHVCLNELFCKAKAGEEDV